MWGNYDWHVTPRQENKLLTHLLRARQIEPAQEEAFLHPDFVRHLHDPFLLSGMKAAVNRIQQAREARQTVGIFGDYDADGTPATVLLVEAFKKLGLRTEFYIPERADGYGLSKQGIDSLKERGTNLIITVDCGITGKSMVDYAKEQGIDVIVTDHHEPQADLLPDAALAVINPKTSPDYPFSGLSGTAVAWKLLQALSQELGQPTMTDLKWGLDLVAVSTIADMVPLRDESRLFTHFGLLVLRRARRPGLKALAEVAGLDPATLNFQQVGMTIGPWLNAAGRMGNPMLAADLLLAQKPHEANQFALELSRLNKSRQQAIDAAWPDVTNQLAAQQADDIIIVYGADWSGGVLGLLAGRLAREQKKIVIALSREGDVWRGSARSGNGHPVLPLLLRERDHLVSCGGHRAAAGLGIADNHLEEAITALKSVPVSALPERETLQIDAELRPDELSWATIELIEQLEPFGVDNERPRFCLRHVPVDTLRQIGRAKNHLQLVLGGYRAVAWQLTPPDWLRPGTLLDVAFSLEPDTYRGGRAVQLIIDDGHHVEAPAPSSSTNTP